MESLDRSKAIIELGKQIVAGLKLGDDVVAQWMAHVVAEKIYTAENAPDNERDAAISTCIEAILKLWAHRYTLPPYMRPLRELDPLLHTLKAFSLDEPDGYRFFARVPSDEELKEATVDEKELFRFVIGIDHAARELVRYFLSVATEQATEAVRPWLEDAVKGDLNVEVELSAYRFVANGLLKAEGEAQQRAMRERAEKLEGFANTALSLAKEMRKSLPSDVEDSGA